MRELQGNLAEESRWLYQSTVKSNLRIKLSGYMAGVVVWVVNPEECIVEVYRVGEVAQEIDEEGTLTAEDILPGFKLPVKNIFRNLKKVENESSE